jgi:alcohol dehydrogenase class IV
MNGKGADEPLQKILDSRRGYAGLDDWLQEKKQNKLFLVCGNSIRNLEIGRYFDTLEKRLGIHVIRFDGFQPNPQMESVVEGVRLLNQEGCRLVVAVGGGSAMDVAKCIKLYAGTNFSQNVVEQMLVPNDICLLAVPTTAGSGSEATRFAVVYDNGKKQSIADVSIIPEAVLMDSSALETLPEYHRKSTMLDALCHATESFWSVNSTPESRQLSGEAVRLVLEYGLGYLSNTEVGNRGMLRAAYTAGRAINIAQTTAGHAMCYKLTGLYGIAHGHAAALCVSELFPYMLEHMWDCTDPRGPDYLREAFYGLAEAFACDSPYAAAEKFAKLPGSLHLERPFASERDYEILKNSVNPERLKNNPVRLETEAIDSLYHRMLCSRGK